MQMPIRSGAALFAAALTLGASTGVAYADMPVTYTEGSRALFHLSAPDFWTVRAGGPRDLTAPGDDASREVVRVIGLEPSSEPHVWMGFVSPLGVSNFAEAEDYLREIGPHLVQDATASGSKSLTIGGRSARSVSGTGRRNGRGVSFSAVMIDLPNGRMAVSVTVLENGVNPDLVADVNSIFASFRAAE
ncbi:hypothetical protein [Falsiphaeobacter marinintestinus]|uniref:hypothetical protein n=1 Tax=Falsiphaeobacter marinintestinus TaxID=1492905 RepID=UPI001FEACD77|nr:hypothetical protein [Phaeobacter marinintestinus]